jgi:hypothetical protein
MLTAQDQRLAEPGQLIALGRGCRAVRRRRRQDATTDDADANTVSP